MHHHIATRPGARPTITHVNRPGTLLAVGLVVGALALAGCSPTQPTASTSSSATGTASAAGGTVVLVTHDSFALPDDLIKQFEPGHRLDSSRWRPGTPGRSSTS